MDALMNKKIKQSSRRSLGILNASLKNKNTRNFKFNSWISLDFCKKVLQAKFYSDSTRCNQKKSKKSLNWVVFVMLIIFFT